MEFGRNLHLSRRLEYVFSVWQSGWEGSRENAQRLVKTLLSKDAAGLWPASGIATAWAREIGKADDEVGTWLKMWLVRVVSGW